MSLNLCFYKVFTIIFLTTQSIVSLDCEPLVGHQLPRYESRCLIESCSSVIESDLNNGNDSSLILTVNVDKSAAINADSDLLVANSNWTDGQPIATSLLNFNRIVNYWELKNQCPKNECQHYPCDRPKVISTSVRVRPTTGQLSPQCQMCSTRVQVFRYSNQTDSQLVVKQMRSGFNNLVEYELILLFICLVMAFL